MPLDLHATYAEAITAAAWIRVAKHKSFNRIASHEWVHWGWNLYTDGSGVARFGVGQDNKVRRTRCRLTSG